MPLYMNDSIHASYFSSKSVRFAEFLYTARQLHFSTLDAFFTHAMHIHLAYHTDVWQHHYRCNAAVKRAIAFQDEEYFRLYASGTLSRDY